MKSLGICLGASSIGIVELGQDDESSGTLKITSAVNIPHDGNPRKLFAEKAKELGIAGYDYIGVTGRKFRELVNLDSVTEPEATERAFEFLTKQKKQKNISGKNKLNVIVSAGGETFIVYLLDHNGRIANVYTGNKCASGTGEFFLQQIKRMGLGLDDSVRIAVSETPHRVSGRCSVFCKSDCTHALNKGIQKAKVVAGLCEMMAKKIIELLAKIHEPRIMVVGGAAQNRAMIDFLKKEIDTVYVPKEAPYFEALGAALWAINKKATPEFADDADALEHLFKKSRSSFSFLRPLAEFKDKVVFGNIKKSRARAKDTCIIGLDVGSTTTKAVLFRTEDDAMLASSYLRTNGNPVQASRNCYKELIKHIGSRRCSEIRIIGLGVTGSGRHIAGLHALTGGIINEIIAHATAAVHFDKDVDTIFEIGGQDAKYTYITNSVPSDYAMNEACSAGTGSFLEEAAKESLGIDVTKIAGLALKGKAPPNFNDQCAAFISSDIKTAFHEGISREDIVAGLIYSICMNYNNRVKGSRPVGSKVFMQGGVCYNKAVPIAMAALTGKNIIVPPEPGLMGAYGVALEIKQRLGLGLMKEQRFDLKELADREAGYGKSFICSGGKEKCDRKCEIMTIKINGKVYPFGGACDKYYNQRLDINYDTGKLDIVKIRQELFFGKYARPQHDDGSLDKQANKNGKSHKKRLTIGINRSFLTNSFYPLYYNFFKKLGMDVVLSENVLEHGRDRKGAAFCYPAEISHGLFMDLLDKNPDYIFLPTILDLPVKSNARLKKTCVFVQAEHAYIRTAFRDMIKKKTKPPTILSPVLRFSGGYDAEKAKFKSIAHKLGFSPGRVEKAFDYAVSMQRAYEHEARSIGKKLIKELEKTPEKHAVVLFGRPYNAYADEANMGIPHKFASRGTMIIPVEFLPYEKEDSFKKMYWGMGHINLMAAKYVKKHPQLFGAYITNFSCGPDSFIIGYFRDIMGVKPSLTLELDSHTADAGLNTRIDAFLDIVKRFRELEKSGLVDDKKEKFRPARVVVRNKKSYAVSSSGKKYLLSHPSVKLLVPTMGRLGTEAFVAVMQSIGINADVVPYSDPDALHIGRANTSCKECLPMLLTTGALLKYAQKNKKKDEMLIYFMPSSSGPCRFGQYGVYMRKLIKKKKIKDVAILSLSDQNNYLGLGPAFVTKSWKGLIAADVMLDIRNALRAIAKDKKRALEVFEAEWARIKASLNNSSKISLEKQIKKSAEVLKTIPLTQQFKKANKIALVGEIYVRQDELSRNGLIEKLAKKGIIVRVAPISEFIYYTNYITRNKLSHNKNLSKKESLALRAFLVYMKFHERKIKRLFEKSGLYEFEMIDIASTINHTSHLMTPKFCGEAILTTGLALKEIINTASGVISIGPFACMPSRVAEAILNEETTVAGKATASKQKGLLSRYKGITNLPYLAIETDAGPYPQIIEARLETFCLQSERMHKRMLENKKR